MLQGQFIASKERANPSILHQTELIMRKVKALVAIAVMAVGIGSVSHASLRYGYLMGYAGASNGWITTFGVAAVFACAPFTGPAAIGCGLAAVG